MSPHATNLVVLAIDDGELTAVVNGSSARAVDPDELVSLLPDGGGVVIAEAATWDVRTVLPESTGSWETHDDRDRFLVALHLAGYEPRSLSRLRVRKLCKLGKDDHPSAELLAERVHGLVAGAPGDSVWCGRCDDHSEFTEGRAVLASHRCDTAGVPVVVPTSEFFFDDRPLVAFDWSIRAVDATSDGVHVVRYPDIASLVATLEEPTKLLAECTFESWDRSRRLDVLELLRAGGHELYVYRPTHTARRRPAGLEKTDESDARVIYANGTVAAEGRFHVYPAPGEANVHWVRRRSRALREYQLIRDGERKSELAAFVKEVFGPYRRLDEDVAAALGNGTSYSTTMTAVLHFAAQWTRSRDEFERLLGLHGSGRPSLLRSEVHHHVRRHADQRGVTWPQFRAGLRRARRQLLEHGIALVAEPDENPSAEELMAALAASGFPVTVAAAERAVEALRG